MRIRRLDLPPTFSHSQPLGPRLFGTNRRRRRGEWGFFYPLMWARLREPPFRCLLQQVGGCRDSGRAFSGLSSPGKLGRDDQSCRSASRQVYVRRRSPEACALPHPTSWERSRKSLRLTLCQTSIPHAFHHVLPRRCHQNLA